MPVRRKSLLRLTDLEIVSAYNERFLNQKDCPLYASVKDYGDSCADLDQLYEAMWWAIELGAYTPQVQS